MHPFDRYFYDPVKHEFTVGRFLDDVEQRYGGIDAMVFWPTYPVLGIDSRNQYDLFRAMPGGLDAVKEVTAALAARGVTVLWPYLFWDQGTRAEGGTDASTMATLLKKTGGRGINGDSRPFVDRDFWQAGRALNYSLALQAEGGTRDAALNWSATGWGYWGRQSNPSDAAGYNWSYAAPPLVDRFKYVTTSEYTTGLCDRYDRNRTSLIQMAWFNGDAYVSWENVWGAFNKFTERAGELLRRFSAMARFWGSYGFLSSPQWEPYAAVIDSYGDGLYASRWPIDSKDLGGPATLWTIVGRGGRNLTAVRLRLNLTGASDVFDCYHGRVLPLAMDGTVTLDFVESGALGCIVALPRPAPQLVLDHLHSMATMTSRSVASFDPTWHMMNMTLVHTASTSKPAAGSAPPAGLVLVPRAPQFRFQSTTVAVENLDSMGGGEQYPWESAPHRAHDKVLDVGPFWIHQHLVTCADFQTFLSNASYSPRDPTNFLKNWNSKDWDALKDEPVVWVSYSEAKAYCKWSGGRLPHSYEWQLAGQGTDGRKYPWGNDSGPALMPSVCLERAGCGPEAVGKHPAAKSPFGVEDLLGNVWQFTADEFVDDHTRRVVLRGGSNYLPADPSHSGWYFPQAKDLVTHNTLLLMDDSFERAATVGFRCVMDA
tara:strand:- start:70 stop:2031 length:1962 start_codon:yes stop_codon:yes gene_type:complete